MEDEKITHKIIGCCYRVYNALGFGYLESVYQKAMSIELTKAGLIHELESPLTVFYENHVVGNFSIDILVSGTLLVELKSVQQLNKSHEAQLVNYLTGTKKDIGLLINFGPKKVEVKKKFRNYVPSSSFSN